MSLNLIVPPNAEPITVAEVKLNGRIDGDELDSLIPGYIAAVRSYAEQYTGRRFINQTLELVLDAFPVRGIDLQVPQVSSIVSVKYIDLAGTEQTIAPSSYALDNASTPCWLLPAYGTSWPDSLDTVNAVRIQFVAGFGAAASNVPNDIRIWLLTRVTQLVQQPDGLRGKDISPDPFLDQMLHVWKTYW